MSFFAPVTDFVSPACGECVTCGEICNQALQRLEFRFARVKAFARRRCCGLVIGLESGERHLDGPECRS